MLQITRWGLVAGTTGRIYKSPPVSLFDSGKCCHFLLFPHLINFNLETYYRRSYLVSRGGDENAIEILLPLFLRSGRLHSFPWFFCLCFSPFCSCLSWAASSTFEGEVKLTSCRWWNGSWLSPPRCSAEWAWSCLDIDESYFIPAAEKTPTAVP